LPFSLNFNQGEVLFNNLLITHFTYPEILQTINSILKPFDAINWLVSTPSVRALLIAGLSIVGFIDLGDDVLRWAEILIVTLGGTQFAIQEELRLLKLYDTKSDKERPANQAETAWELIVWNQRVAPRLFDF
jgi:hypothetical protein